MLNENVLAEWHVKVREAAATYNLKENQRVNIVNTGYLELIELYKSLYKKKKTLVETQMEKYNGAIHCLKMSSDMMHKLALDLDLAKPQLEATKKELITITKVIIATIIGTGSARRTNKEV